MAYQTMEVGLGEYSIKVNTDEDLLDVFTSLAIDPHKLSIAALEMGVEDTIRRRLNARRLGRATNSLTFSYQSQPIVVKNLELPIAGLFSAQTKGFGGMQRADIHVAPVTILDEISKAPIGDLQKKAKDHVGSTTLHEIGHFVDPALDIFYRSDLSWSQRKRLERRFWADQKQKAANSTPVAEKQAKLENLLPDGKIKSKVFMHKEVLLDKALTEGLGYLRRLFELTDDKEVYGPVTRVRRQIRFDKGYYQFPIEVYARKMQQAYKNLGAFCTLELKPYVPRDEDEDTLVD